MTFCIFQQLHNPMFCNPFFGGYSRGFGNGILQGMSFGIGFGLAGMLTGLLNKNMPTMYGNYGMPSMFSGITMPSMMDTFSCGTSVFNPWSMYNTGEIKWYDTRKQEYEETKENSKIDSRTKSVEELEAENKKEDKDADKIKTKAQELYDKITKDLEDISSYNKEENTKKYNALLDRLVALGAEPKSEDGTVTNDDENADGTDNGGTGTTPEGTSDVAGGTDGTETGDNGAVQGAGATGGTQGTTTGDQTGVQSNTPAITQNKVGKYTNLFYGEDKKIYIKKDNSLALYNSPSNKPITINNQLCDVKNGEIVAHYTNIKGYNLYKKTEDGLYYVIKKDQQPIPCTTLLGHPIKIGEAWFDIKNGRASAYDATKSAQEIGDKIYAEADEKSGGAAVKGMKSVIEKYVTDENIVKVYEQYQLKHTDDDSIFETMTSEWLGYGKGHGRDTAVKATIILLQHFVNHAKKLGIQETNSALHDVIYGINALKTSNGVQKWINNKNTTSDYPRWSIYDEALSCWAQNLVNPLLKEIHKIEK